MKNFITQNWKPEQLHVSHKHKLMWSFDGTLVVFYSWEGIKKNWTLCDKFLQFFVRYGQCFQKPTYIASHFEYNDYRRYFEINSLTAKLFFITFIWHQFFYTVIRHQIIFFRFSLPVRSYFWPSTFLPTTNCIMLFGEKSIGPM